MSEPSRILQIVTKMDRAGLETMLMNYYRAINRDKIQFDFLTHRAEEGAYDAEILSMGGRIYRMSAISPRTIFEYEKELSAFFLQHSEYKIVHSHIDALSALPLRAAKKVGIAVRIAHSHNNGFDKDAKLPLRYIAKAGIKSVATDYWACSAEALSFMFGEVQKEHTHILKNAIDIRQYRFDRNIREEYRQRLGLSDRFVMGHVGRFSYQKNHEMLLDIFREIKKKEPAAALVLAGEGELEERIKARAKELGISNDVQFLGARDDIPQLMQAMDVFVLPSRFEGLGIVLIEAQSAGLGCFASDAVSREADISGVCFLPKGAGAAKWADEILSARPAKRDTGADSVCAAGYDISLAAAELSDIYTEMMRR